MRPTDVFFKVMDASKEKRVICAYGGSSSSKTISVLQLLTTLAFRIKGQVFTIVGESYPVLKKTVIRDWERFVMMESYRGDLFNNRELTYSFPSGSIFQFVPADDSRRFHGMRQDYCMIDEAYNVSKEIFDQIDIRTRKKIFLTWNPVAEFWGKRLEDRPDSVMLHSTYHDNQFLEKSIRDTLELRAKTDENFYRVYVLGEYGNLEGLVFSENKHWFKVDELPVEYKWRAFGLDFGFTHDPTALIEIRYSDGKLWLQEHLYQNGLINREIYDRIKILCGRERVVGDSAEPKSIEELRRLGLNIVGAKKGADSVRHGINTLKGYSLMVTKTSLNLVKELRNLNWKKGKEGYLEQPIDNWNHLIDGLRYGTEKLREKKTGKYIVS